MIAAPKTLLDSPSRSSDILDGIFVEEEERVPPVLASFGTAVLRKLRSRRSRGLGHAERMLRVSFKFFDSSAADLATLVLIDRGFAVLSGLDLRSNSRSISLEASLRVPMDSAQLDELGDWLIALLDSFQGRFDGFEI